MWIGSFASDGISPISWIQRKSHLAAEVAGVVEQWGSVKDSARLQGRYEGAGARTYEADRRHESKWAREDAVVRAMVGRELPPRAADGPVEPESRTT